MNIELINLWKERLHKASADLVEIGIKQHKTSDDYKNTQSLIGELAELICNEYTREIGATLSGFDFVHGTHGKCLNLLQGKYDRGDDIVHVRFLLAPFRFVISDDMPYKAMCEEWNEHEEAGDDFYLEQQITMLPSGLKDSPAVSIFYQVKAGDTINFREFFTKLSDELRERNTVLQPC